MKNEYSTNFLDGFKTIKKITPIIVCGMARSGTRMLTDLLNNHDQIAIQNEMHAKTIEAFFNLKKEVDGVFSHYEKKEGRRKNNNWLKSQNILMHTFFASANKKGILGYKKKIKFHGIKTPGYERYLSDFEDIFSSTPPFYMYCIRRPEKVWRSWKSIGYLIDFKVFQQRYLRSLRQAQRIRNAVPKRLIIFNLDDYIKTEDKHIFIQNNIFNRMGIESIDRYKEVMDTTPNRNALKNKGSKYIEDKLMAEEMNTLMSNEEIRERRKALLGSSDTI